MNSEEFSKMVGTIAHSFTKAPKLTKDYLSALWDRVGHIDGRHCGQIAARLSAQEEFPNNLGNAILGAFRSLDPEAAVPSDERERFSTKCSECDPGAWKGQIVAFKKNDQGGVDKFYFDCPLCRPSGQFAASRVQIAERGYIVPPTQWDVAKFYFRMFVANNQDLVRRVNVRFDELLADPRRCAAALRETPDERGEG
ncbi:MAG: hypothetical protein RDU24_08955 [Humidesulfovibrio sp.]|uniref:hypothetical protein n=1 Tax=Humidesulfovibrio sp. TaxID=2910988 RepID=UPI0027F67589|nr:hypothetical protein [Humidesulfovibrio sp.]MDQ7835497.1 hypothetical protein [Humidesulfovibrio sp.]